MKTLATKNCLLCNKKFKTVYVKKKLFCSSKCREKFNQSTSRAKNADKFKYQKNKRIYKLRSKEQYKKNKKEILLKEKIKRKNLTDIEKYKVKLKRKPQRKKWNSSLKGIVYNRFENQKKRLLVKVQTPKWNDEKKTKEIFRTTAKIEKLFNDKDIKFNVDHIIPLKGKTYEDGSKICGLNVWYNLMPLLEEANKKKQSLCPPVKQIKGSKINHLSLDKLPEAKHWMRFIRSIYKAALKYKKDDKNKENILANYIETNPRDI
jgi:hypothetical protein